MSDYWRRTRMRACRPLAIRSTCRRTARRTCRRVAVGCGLAPSHSHSRGRPQGSRRVGGAVPWRHPVSRASPRPASSETHSRRTFRSTAPPRAAPEGVECHQPVVVGVSDACLEPGLVDHSRRSIGGRDQVTRATDHHEWTFEPFGPKGVDRGGASDRARTACRGLRARIVNAVARIELRNSVMTLCRLLRRSRPCGCPPFARGSVWRRPHRDNSSCIVPVWPQNYIVGERPARGGHCVVS